MHELSLAEGIREIVMDQAREHGFARVTRMRLEIGQLAAVEREALVLAFAVAMEGSPAEGATLEIVDVAGRGMCHDCGREVAMATRLDPCPACGGLWLVPTDGEGMRIRDMEVL